MTIKKLIALLQDFHDQDMVVKFENAECGVMDITSVAITTKYIGPMFEGDRWLEEDEMVPETFLLLD